MLSPSQLLRRLQPVFAPIAGPSRLPALAPLPSPLVQRRSISFVPRKRKWPVKYKRTRIGWHTGSAVRGSTVRYGSHGIRTLYPARVKQASFQSCHLALLRYTKDYKDVRIIWRKFPDIGISEKGLEIQMGKGRGNFSYLCAAPRANSVLVELACPHMTSAQIRRALKSASAKIPSKCEVISRDGLPKVGTELVPRDWKPPHSMLRGALPAGNVIYQGARSNAEMLADFKALADPSASDYPIKQVLVTSGGHEGERMNKLELLAASPEPRSWRQQMLRLYRKPKHQRRFARVAADRILARQEAKAAEEAARMPDIVAP